MLTYLRTVTIGLLTFLAISTATVTSAMADEQTWVNPWEDAKCFWYEVTGPAS